MIRNLSSLLKAPIFRCSSALLPALLAILVLAGCAGTKPKPEPEEAQQSQQVPTEATSGTISPLIGSLKVVKFKLDNGLKLLVVEDHSSPTFAYQTWYNVGSRDEAPNYTGLAHLFEHMMFKGTQNHKQGEFDRALSTAGVEHMNAFTSHDYTAYVQELPKDKLELISQLESDRMSHLIVDQQSFKTETGVVLNERGLRSVNNPDGVIEQALFELAFTKHPYHWPIIGYQPDLERMSGDDATRFYRSYYSPNHATVVVIGDVDANDVLATVKKYYGSIPGQGSPVRTIEEEPAQESARHKVLKLNMKTEKLMMGYHIPSIRHDDVPALFLLQSVLSGGQSSRLLRALVDTGIATGVSANSYDAKDPSLFLIVCNLQQGKRAAQAETIVLKELSQLTQHPIGDKELERARNNLNFGFYQNLDSAYGKAQFLGTYETIAGGFENGIAIQKKAVEVTAPELQAVVKRYFQPNNRSVITGVPTK